MEAEFNYYETSSYYFFSFQLGYLPFDEIC